MPRLLLSGCISVILIVPIAMLAQVKPSDIHEHGAVACIESPTSGKRPAGTDCAILLQKKFSSLPSGPLVWRFENFPSEQPLKMRAPQQVSWWKQQERFGSSLLRQRVASRSQCNDAQTLRPRDVVLAQW